jgi:hypothetical protein
MMKSKQTQQKTDPTKKAPPVPKAGRWVTTDDEERTLRNYRAQTEAMRVRPLDRERTDVFGDYEVVRTDTDEAVPYVVELRSRTEAINSCTCPDFRKNFLGTCKHIERVLMGLRRPRRDDPTRSPRTELFMTRNPYEPLLLLGDGATAGDAPGIAKHVDRQGRLLNPGAAALSALIEACETAAKQQRAERVRVSSEVRDHQQRMEGKERLARARDALRGEIVTAGGAMPFLKQPLYPYQIDGMLHLAFKGRAMLADEMGLGKTVQAVAAAAVMREAMGVRRVLVVAPASLKTEWEEQVSAFTDLPQEVLFGGRPTRLLRYRHTSAFFLIANYEQVLRDYREINLVLRPDLVILDEAQRIKNWRTKTAQRLKRLEAPFAFVLTGTPLENRIDELYSLTEFIDPSLFGSLFHFNRRYYCFDSDGKAAGMQRLDELHTRVGQIMLRRRKDDVEEQLPERVDKTYFVHMTREQKELYDDHEAVVARLYHLAKRRPLRPEEMKRLQNALACMRMSCDTCYILDRETRIAPKLDELEKILDDLWADTPGRKVLIFSEWVRMLELVEERLKRRKCDYALHIGSMPQQERRTHIRRFKSDPQCHVFLSSESGGVGLNLQAASVVVNLDLPWNPAKLEQRIARAWRKHQLNRVNVINLVSENTLEHRMLATLKFKQGLADVVLDARGAAADFEKSDARGAFMARLAEVMDTPLQVPLTSAAAQAPERPPEERMAETLKRENPGVGLCLGRYDAESGVIQALLAVGCQEAAATLRGQVEQTHGVVLPPERVVVVPPETRALLQRLADLGFITIRADAAKTLLDTGSDTPPPPPEHSRRCKRARDALGTAQRKLRMAEVLADGGFADEAAGTARQAIRQAAGTLFLFTPGAPLDQPLEPLTEAMVAAIRDDAGVARELVAAVQTAHLNVAAAPEVILRQARECIDNCAERLDRQQIRCS